jgi:hypothetical protein
MTTVQIELPDTTRRRQMNTLCDEGNYHYHHQRSQYPIARAAVD